MQVSARFNNYPHFMDNVLIRVTEIKENKKIIYGYLMRIMQKSMCSYGTHTIKVEQSATIVHLFII